MANVEESFQEQTSELESDALLTPAKIDALIRLLGDEDPKIHRVAQMHLGKDVDVTRPYLEEYSRTGSDSLAKARAGLLLTELTRNENVESWKQFVSSFDEPLDLERGAFLIAEVEYPDLDAAAHRARLDEIADVLAHRISRSMGVDAVVSKLNHLLFRELGFKGNREDYYSPDNNLINRVLERKLGIPITLSTLCILVGKRIGLKLEGIGLPGHFILRYRSDRRERFFDPFNGGRPWTLEDCRYYLRGEGYKFNAEVLRAYSARKTLSRTLSNLLHIYRARNDVDRTARIERMLAVVYPTAKS